MIGKIIKFGILGILGCIVLFVAGLWLWFGSNHYEWRQKITVNVDTPQGPVSASAVQNVVVEKGRNPVPGHPPGSRSMVTGEAVSLDLGNGHYLFALLKVARDDVGAGNIGDIITRITSPKLGARTHPALKRSENLPVGASYLIPQRYYPLLVTFDDINDPSSVKQVNPDNLAASFGAGYSLKSMTVEITREPISAGHIDTLLSWIPSFIANGYRLNGEKCIACPISSDRLADLLSGTSFKLGEK